jgi:hypothetical protein
MAEPAGRARFLFEASQRPRIGRRGREELDRDAPADFYVAGNDNPAHASAAKLRLDYETLLEFLRWASNEARWHRLRQARPRVPCSWRSVESSSVALRLTHVEPTLWMPRTSLRDQGIPHDRV